MSPDRQEIQRQLAAIAVRFPALGEKLGRAAQQLQAAGTPLEPGLFEELGSYQQQFNHLRSQILELARQMSIMPAAEEVASVRGLEATLQRCGAAGVNPAAVLDGVLAIAHQETPQFAPLVDCQTRARQLRDRANSLTPSEIAPFADLLTMITEASRLDDHQWGKLQNSVAIAFGQPLAVAASRGKLITRSAPATTPAPFATATPSPDVTILPSAKQNDDVILFGAPAAAPAPAIPSMMQASPPPGVQAGVQTSYQPGFQTEHVGLQVLVHLRSMGDRPFREGEFAGTRGQFRALEGFQITFNPPVPGLSLRYMAHLEGIGDSQWVEGGEFVGTRGQNRRLEGFAIQLAGPQAPNYEVSYMAHVENIGDTTLCSNGQFCGTRGQGLRLEGLQVSVRKK